VVDTLRHLDDWPPGQSGHIHVDGCEIGFDSHGNGAETILLVHGKGAHRHWWHAVIASLPRDFHVVSLDLSGHGDSGRRKQYGPGVFSDEIVAAGKLLGRDRVHVVGHSMGGRCAAMAAGRHPDLFQSLTILDSVFPVRPRLEQSEGGRRLPDYGDLETIRRRFRLLPLQPLPEPQVLAPVVAHAMAATSTGWRWKFHADGHWLYEDEAVNAALAEITCPITVGVGTRSALPSAASAERITQAHPGTVVVSVTGGHHHLPLDSPEATARIILDAAGRAAPE
jgi:pimeloyl-ACP methyl ester carboxylesterase